MNELNELQQQELTKMKSLVGCAFSKIPTLYTDHTVLTATSFVYKSKTLFNYLNILISILNLLYDNFCRQFMHLNSVKENCK